MLNSKTRWVVRETDHSAAQELANQLNIAPLVAALLINRGINNLDDARTFLNIENEEFHDPFLFSEMEKSIERINLAIEREESILIFGDYDADGVTSTTVLMEILNEKGANVTYYIPNRFTEGYGPNEAAFRKAKIDGIHLIITVDTGIAALNEAKVAKELGIDLIITDHHEPGPKLPDAYSIIHPKLHDNHYPFADLAGVGVAFKLAHALHGDVPWHLLDLAVIGTIADLVPLHGENRLIVKAGLKRIANSNRSGLQELCKIAGTKLAEVNEETIGFAIAPRLNAAGRLDHAGPAVELLLAQDIARAEQLAEEIDAMNKERQQIVAEIANEAIRIVEEEFPPSENSVIVIGKEGWNPGVIGIVASRLVEKFYRPAIVLSYDLETGLAKGSARSIHGFDLFKNLSASAEILPHFGGHPMAAGMTLKIEDVELLRERLNLACNEQLSPNDFIPVTELDTTVQIDEINIDSISQMELLAPFGMKNPKPKIMIEQVSISGIKKIGANKNHLKLILEDSESTLDGVGFNLGSLANQISPETLVSVIGELSINEWNNIRKPQIFLKDIAVNDWQLFDIRGHKQVQQWIPEMNDQIDMVIFFNEEHTKSTLSKDIVDKAIVLNSIEQAETLNINGMNIVLYDLPEDITMMEQLISQKAPGRIYAHFFQEQDHYFTTIPTREHFKWYYAFLLQRKSFDFNKYGQDLAAHRGWSHETIKFMSQVFFELDFVTIKNGFITVNAVKGKKDLGDSPTFQKKQNQIKLEKELLYSSYQQLKQWFDDRLAHDAVPYEEEKKVWI